MRHIRGHDRRAQTALFAFHGLERLAVPSSSDGQEYPERFTESTQRAYPFTTENLTGYIEELPIAGRDIAAVCGSGDFPINACAYGARSVDAVDVMPVACMYAELKAAGIVELTAREFHRFFDRSSAAFPFGLYERLRSGLSDQTTWYFDRLITPRGTSRFLLTEFFIDKVQDGSMPTRMNPYLQSDHLYDRAASNMRSLLFHPTSISTFLESVNPESYGLIYLSNIFAYMYGKDIDRTVALAASRLTATGEVVAVNPLSPDNDLEEAEAYNHSLARRHGMVARHLTAPMPHMHDDRRRYLICAMGRATG